MLFQTYMDKEPPLWPWSSMSTIYDPNEENVDNMPNMGEDIIDGNVTFRRRFKLKTNQHRPNRTSSVKKSSDLKTTATMKRNIQCHYISKVSNE